MPLSILLPTVITLSLIVYQDLHSRTVSWFLFLLLAAAGTGSALSGQGSFRLWISSTSLNLLFLLLQFGLLKGWLFLKKGRNEPVVDRSIGRGDIFFLLAVCCLFPPVLFILFYLFSLLFALLLFLVLRSAALLPGRLPTVPLAGFQAAFLVIVLFVIHILNYPVTNDGWLIPKLLS